MFISKSGLSRMLAVVMVSTTLMSAMHAQADAKNVAKKVATFTYNAGKAGIMVLALLSAYENIKGSPSEEINLKNAAGLTFISIVLGESIYNSYKQKPSCDKEVTTAKVSVAATK